MKPIRELLLVILMSSLFWFTGCIDEITFETAQTKGQLIVDGRLTNSPGPHTIKLSRTQGNSTKGEPIINAELWLVDDVGNRVSLVEDGEGSYSTIVNQIIGEMGKSYSLEINLNDGSNYKSQQDTIPLLNANDSVHFEFVTEMVLSSSGILIEVNKIQVFFDSEIPAGSIYLKWDLQHVYPRISPDPPPNPDSPLTFCYISSYPSPQDFVLTYGNDTSFNIEEQLVGSKKIDSDFINVNAMSIIQSSLSSEAYQYWERVNLVINSVGNIFDVPGATVPGNIYNVNDPEEQILGYFEAVARDTTSIILSRADLPADIVIQPPCWELWDRLYNKECSNCLVIPGSSLKIPGFWPN